MGNEQKKPPDMGWALMRIFGSLAYIGCFGLLVCGLLCGLVGVLMSR